MEQQSKLRRILFVFGYFARIGAFTFGGGWSIIAQMQRDFVDRRGWLTEDDLMDMTSIGRSLPGVMIGNVSFMFGYRMAGVPGGVAAVLGMNLAPFRRAGAAHEYLRAVLRERVRDQSARRHPRVRAADYWSGGCSSCARAACRMRSAGS